MANISQLSYFIIELEEININIIRPVVKIKRIKRLPLLILSLTILMSACEYKEKVEIPQEITRTVDIISQTINSKDRKGFLECIDINNSEFYAEENHLFEDIESADITNLKLQITGLSRVNDSIYNVDLIQSYDLNNEKNSIKYTGVFKSYNGSFKFHDLYFDIISTDHFTIKYSPSLSKEAQLFSAFVEDAYKNVKNIYGITPSGRTIIKLYEDNDVFSWFIKPSINFLMSGWYEYPESIKINLGLQKEKKYDEPTFRIKYLKTLSHELTHRTNMQESNNNIPYWMAEGIATFVENNGVLKISPPALKVTELEKINLEKLSESKDISDYYTNSYINVSLFINKFGLNKLHDILRELGKFPLQVRTGGPSIEDSNNKFHKVIESCLSLTINQLDREISK